MRRFTNDRVQCPGRTDAPEAALILLAGGMSRRMGRNKALLPIHGRPMFQHILEQLEPHFAEVLVSGTCTGATAPPGITVVPDRVPQQGPLRGIASCLEVTRHDLNFVVACDMPEIDVDRVLGMLSAAEGFDVVVERDAQGRWEPLFGVYRRSALAVAREVLDRGGRRIVEIYPQLRVRIMDPSGDGPLFNINDESEYQQYLAQMHEGER